MEFNDFVYKMRFILGIEIQRKTIGNKPCFIEKASRANKRT